MIDKGKRRDDGCFPGDERSRKEVPALMGYQGVTSLIRIVAADEQERAPQPNQILPLPISEPFSRMTNESSRCLDSDCRTLGEKMRSKSRSTSFRVR